MFNCCSHGTLLHIGPQESHLSICYYHQDLHQWRLQANSRSTPSTHTTATLLLVRIFLSDYYDYPYGRVWAQRYSAIHFQG